MPASRRSLLITDAYRERLVALQARAGRAATAEWAAVVSVDDLDGTHPEWIARASATLATIQTAGVRLSGAYLAAYTRSELARPVNPPALELARYAGVSRTGKPLAEALVTTVITVKQAIGAGTAPDEALERGRTQAARLAVTETVSAARAALGDAMRASDRVVGWRRVTGGGCGACLAAATGAIHADDEALPVHDNCQCTTEPVVAQARDTVQRPSGLEMFRAMPVEAQDAALGPQLARAVRDGSVDFHEMAGTSPMDAIADQLTQRPLADLVARADQAPAA